MNADDEMAERLLKVLSEKNASYEEVVELVRDVIAHEATRCLQALTVSGTVETCVVTVNLKLGNIPFSVSVGTQDEEAQDVARAHAAAAAEVIGLNIDDYEQHMEVQELSAEGEDIDDYEIDPDQAN